MRAAAQCLTLTASISRASVVLRGGVASPWPGGRAWRPATSGLRPRGTAPTKSTCTRPSHSSCSLRPDWEGVEIGRVLGRDLPG